MNEEELKEQLFKWAERKEMNLDDDMQFQKFIKKGISLGFQKGKLEQKKEILNILIKKRDYYKKLWLKAVEDKNKHQEDIFYNTYFNFEELIKQLQKEIGGMK